MKAILEKYKEYLSEKKSKNTVLSYVSDVNRFLDEYDIKMKKDLLKTDTRRLEEYVAILKSRGMAYSSITRASIALKNFFSFCVIEGMELKENSINLSVPATKRKLPNTLSSQEVIKLLETPSVNTVKGKRDKAILEMMYATGAKVSEIINLKINDISLKNEMINIQTGTNHRLVPLGHISVEAIELYLKESRPKLATESSGDYLFLNFYGQPLTRQGFWKIVKRYIKEAGINPNVSAQTIRHSFALHLLKNGADVESVSEMLGFGDVSSTKIYIDVMNSKIKEVYKAAHPRA